MMVRARLPERVQDGPPLFDVMPVPPCSGAPGAPALAPMPCPAPPRPKPHLGPDLHHLAPPCDAQLWIIRHHLRHAMCVAGTCALGQACS